MAWHAEHNTKKMFFRCRNKTFGLSQVTICISDWCFMLFVLGLYFKFIVSK